MASLTKKFAVHRGVIISVALVMALALVGCGAAATPTNTVVTASIEARTTAEITAVSATSSPSAAPTQIGQAASATAVAVSGPSASETAIANAISSLFTATAISAVTATQFAADHPSPVPPTLTPDPQQDPAFAASAWLVAFLSSDGAALGRYSCRARAEEVSDTAAINDVLMGGLSVLLGLTAPGQTFSIDISHVTFTVTQQSSSQALVHSQGEAQIAVGGQFQTGSADGDFIMIYEDGRWKWCGFVGE